MKLSNWPHTLQRFNLSEMDDIQVYNLDSWYWQYQNISYSFNVKCNRVLLMHRVGVTLCVDINAHIADAERANVSSPRKSVHNTPMPHLWVSLGLPTEQSVPVRMTRHSHIAIPPLV